MNGCHNCTHYHLSWPHTVHEEYYCDFDGIEYDPDYICENYNQREE